MGFDDPLLGDDQVDALVVRLHRDLVHHLELEADADPEDAARVGEVDVVEAAPIAKAAAARVEGDAGEQDHLGRARLDGEAVDRLMDPSIAGLELTERRDLGCAHRSVAGDVGHEQPGTALEQGGEQTAGRHLRCVRDVRQNGRGRPDRLEIEHAGGDRARLQLALGRRQAGTPAEHEPSGRGLARADIHDDPIFALFVREYSLAGKGTITT